MNLVLQKWKENLYLKKTSKKVTTFDDWLKNFWESMINFMEKNEWVGLAAPQVGYNIRVITVTNWQKIWNDLKLTNNIVMVNPEILEYSWKKEKDYEWCLSLPGIKVEVERSLNIQVRYQDLEGNYITDKLSWLNARIVQHEVDHLDWVLITDYKKSSDKKISLDLSKFTNV